MSIFVSLHEILPAVAEKETRSMSFGRSLPLLKTKQLHFHELYCATQGCDCRKVMIRVLDPDGEIVATLAYGWEGSSYYKEQKFEDEYIEMMSGVSLEIGAPQSKRADEAKLMFEQLLEDQSYADRIVQHYQLFKQAIIDQNYRAEEDDEDDDEFECDDDETREVIMGTFDFLLKNTIQDMMSAHGQTMVKIGRNDLCSCGSQKKYKKCCMNEIQSDKYRHIPHFSTQEMADSDELSWLATSIEQIFCGIDYKCQIKDIVIKRILERQLDRYYYDIELSETKQKISDMDPGIKLVDKIFDTVVQEYFANEPREMIYKILSTLYQCILHRGTRGRAYIEFLHKHLPVLM